MCNERLSFTEGTVELEMKFLRNHKTNERMKWKKNAIKMIVEHIYFVPLVSFIRFDDFDFVCVRASARSSAGNVLEMYFH